MRGRTKGEKLITKKSIEMKKVIRKRSVYFGGDLTDAELIELTGLSRNTFYKYKLELKAAGVPE